MAAATNQCTRQRAHQKPLLNSAAWQGACRHGCSYEPMRPAPCPPKTTTEQRTLARCMQAWLQLLNSAPGNVPTSNSISMLQARSAQPGPHDSPLPHACACQWQAHERPPQLKSF
eukprot:504023-Pelagomonas_calceolata.AAC.4